MLTLTFKNDEEITLPASISCSSLSLEEIGAVVVMSSLSKLGQSELISALENPALKDATKKLIEKKVLNIGLEGQALKISIDLEVVGA